MIWLVETYIPNEDNPKVLELSDWSHCQSIDDILYAVEELSDREHIKIIAVHHPEKFCPRCEHFQELCVCNIQLVKN